MAGWMPAQVNAINISKQSTERMPFTVSIDNKGNHDHEWRESTAISMASEPIEDA